MYSTVLHNHIHKVPISVRRTEAESKEKNSNMGPYAVADYNLTLCRRQRVESQYVFFIIPAYIKCRKRLTGNLMSCEG
jgi:hypothetical protein